MATINCMVISIFLILLLFADKLNEPFNAVSILKEVAYIAGYKFTKKVISKSDNAMTNIVHILTDSDMSA